MLFCGFVLRDLRGEEIVRTFYNKELQKQIKKNFGKKKYYKKSNKLYIKWKEYYNSFNGWINKKDTVMFLFYINQLFPTLQLQQK